MKFSITATKTVAELQEEFGKYFPFLKIELFTKPHEKGSASWSKHMVFDKATPLSKIENFKAEGEYEFSEGMSVGSFEVELWEKYGLAVQVFRKSMNTWIESTRTDSWTLAYQNQKGEESSHSVPEMIYVGRDGED
jgi:hypothetical protein